MKIYYMTQANVRPPTFVVFTDKPGKLHFSAERYLINRLRERFDFTGHADRDQDQAAVR